LFIAIDLPENLKEKILGVIKNFDKTVANINFVTDENLHITLKFLGEVREDDVNSIVNILSNIAKEKEEYNLNVNGFGFFGNPKFIKTLWLGIHEGKNETIELMEDLNVKLENVKREDFKPSPHLTVGRVKTADNHSGLINEIRKLKDIDIGTFHVKEITLKKSVLTPEGPVYSDIKSFQLGG